MPRNKSVRKRSEASTIKYERKYVCLGRDYWKLVRRAQNRAERHEARKTCREAVCGK
jgi:hypothetical protein